MNAVTKPGRFSSGLGTLVPSTNTAPFSGTYAQLLHSTHVRQLSKDHSRGAKDSGMCSIIYNFKGSPITRVINLNAMITAV
ncbi:unnamed protein product, partial [Nesidiocoris tenuis]